MEKKERVQAYFNRQARSFDRLYKNRAGLSWHFNQLVRRPLYRRFELTMEACGDVRGKRILDVGCGSGRYVIALAEQGAEVTGIDFAPNMLTLARELAEERGAAARCQFIQADFLEYDFGTTFDISLAIGVFDYVPHPLAFLKQLCVLTEEKVIFTFPQPGGLRSTQRRLRYWLKGCPLYFHSPESMSDYLAAAGYRDWRFVGYWAEAYPPGRGTNSSQLEMTS